MKRLIDIDLFAGLGALAWAVTALFVPQLNELVDYRAAGAFGLTALGRFVARVRKQQALEAAKVSEKEL